MAGRRPHGPLRERLRSILPASFQKVFDCYVCLSPWCAAVLSPAYWLAYREMWCFSGVLVTPVPLLVASSGDVEMTASNKPSTPPNSPPAMRSSTTREALLAQTQTHARVGLRSATRRCGSCNGRRIDR